MNTNNENGNSQIPEVPVLDILDTDTAEEIKEKVEAHNQALEDYKTKTTETNAQLYARTKKAEGFELKDGKWVKPEKQTETKATDTSKNTEKDGFSQTDLIAIIKAEVPEEDIQEVADYAKLKGISIKEALASDVVKSILKIKTEERQTAEATSTGSQKRTTVPSGSDLLEKANKTGELPDDLESMGKIIEARKSGKK